MALEISDAFMDRLVEAGFDPVYGARPLKRAIQQELENPLAQRLLAAARQANVPLAVAADDMRVHHGCFIVRTDQRENLAGYLARGERAVRHWQAGMPSTTVRFDAACFANLNQPQDLPAD